MFVPSEMNIPMLSLLLLLFVIVGLLYLLNKWMIVRYKNQKITIGHDLNIVFQVFGERENADEVQLVISKTFWYRPLTNTIGVTNLKSKMLLDALAFLHDLYHHKDRNRVIKIQTLVSLYTYVVSSILKFIALFYIWSGKTSIILSNILILDMLMLFVCLLLTLVIESYASREAVLFLEKNQYVKNNQFIKRVSNRALFSYFFQFVLYIIISALLFYMIV